MTSCASVALSMFGILIILGAFRYSSGFSEVGGVGIVGIVFLCLGISLWPKEYHAYRRKEHSHADIIWEYDGKGRRIANKIMVTNLDDKDVADMGTDLNVHWSSLYCRERVGGGTWIWKFRYMGNKQYNEKTNLEQEHAEYSDPTHQMHLRNTEDWLNNYLSQIINPAKDAI